MDIERELQLPPAPHLYLTYRDWIEYSNLPELSFESLLSGYIYSPQTIVRALRSAKSVLEWYRGDNMETRQMYGDSWLG